MNLYDCAKLLICCINFLDEKIKSRISYYLDNYFLDKALARMIEEENFPDWFRRKFYFDSFHGRLDNLRESFDLAFDSLLVEYVANRGTTGTKIRLAVSNSVYRGIIRKLGLAEEDVKNWAETLERLLFEAERVHQEFLAERAAEAMKLQT